MVADGGGASSLRASASVSKGKVKAKMDADAIAEEAWTCGICLATSREAIRGELDCCAHNFCFVCIMVWARVESRCPFCKARFHSIRRPPIPGRFPSERIVDVPERNQVYCPEGGTNSTVGADAYANIICSVCNCCRHDELLMLCDLCDVPVHTYCVGLGTIVPEGDWFCEDCAAAKEEHSRCQADDEVLDSEDEFEISIDVPTGEAVSLGNRRRVQCGRISMADPVPSIYDIVGDDYTTNAGTIRLRSNFEDFPSQGTPPAGYQCPESIPGRNRSLELYHASIRAGLERTRALRESRNRDKRIRELRENWALLRDGSMEFRTVTSRRTQGGIETVSNVTERQHFVPPAVFRSKNGTSNSSDQRSFVLFSEETSNSLGHGNQTSQKDTRDVRKAWKMLQLARTSGEKNISNRHSSLSNCSAPFSMGNRSTSYSPIDTILGSRNQNLNMVAQENNANCIYGAKMESGSSIEYSEQFCSLPKGILELVHERLISFYAQLNKESSSEVAALTYRHHVNQTLEPGSQSTAMVNPQDSSAVCVATTGEIHRSAFIEVSESSGPDHHEHKRKLSSEERRDQTSKRSKSNCKIAKFEISDLAIRELKQLKIDRAYGSDKFKEVARIATHTVLAACGFEHCQSQSLALSRPVCEHSSEDKLLKSSVIANFCSECLHAFVKEAVNLVLSRRQMDKIV